MNRIRIPRTVTRATTDRSLGSVAAVAIAGGGASTSSRALPMYSKAATAAKDNQNPGASTAHGSISSTSSKASARMCRAAGRRPESTASATTSSM